MTSVLTPTMALDTLADLLEHLGGIAPHRVRFRPSTSNTPREMARKRQEYFSAGVQLVWQIDPRMRTVEVFTASDQSTVLHETYILDGGTVLPGFSLPLQELFAELDLQGED